MVASINTNIPASYAAANLRKSSDALKTGAQRMSSGNQITKASDDAAGLSIGTGLKTSVETLKAALKGSSQASSILSVADGVLQNIGDLLGRLRALAVTANSGAMQSAELGYIKNEMDALVLEVTRVADNTKFNGAALLGGSYTSKNFQVGVDSGDVIAINLSQAMNASGLGIGSMDVTAGGGAVSAMTSLDTAIGTLKAQRAIVGALQSRFSYAASNIESSMINTDAARADYLDADLAAESSAFAASTTKVQAGVAVLAQVNTLPANLLKLIS